MKQENQSRMKLSVLTAALTSALAAMAPTHAQADPGPVVWNSGVSHNYEVTNGTTINSGSLAGPTGVFGSAASGPLGTLTNNGAIQVNATGVLTTAGTIASVINNGIITGNLGVLNDNNTNLGSLGNNATITGNAIGIHNTGTIGILNNSSGGTVSATVGSTINHTGTGIANGNLSVIGTLTNSGSIGGVLQGISNNSQGTIESLSNNTGGVISGSTFGVQNTGTISNFSNDGSITGSAGSGIGSTIIIGTLTNTGTINGGVNGIGNTGGLHSLNNNTGGTIAGTTVGVANGGAIDEFNNTGGTITGAVGVKNSALVGTLTNTGSIQGNTNAIWNTSSIGTLNNNAGGTIHGNLTAILDDGSFTALNNNGGVISGGSSGIFISSGHRIDTLTNSGSISAGIIGINNNNGTIGTLNNSSSIGGGLVGIGNNGTIGALNNSGSISGSSAGIGNDGTTGTLTNSGSISGGNKGITNGGTISALNNSGSISGGTKGIANSGTISALTNTGLIQSSGNAIYNTGVLSAVANNGGTIAGNILNLSNQNLTITGGAGSVFGTLTGSGGGIGAGNISTITNAQSNLIFASGNLLLNDQINATGHTVTNTGAVLQINNTINVTGNYTQNAGGTLNIGVADGANATGVVSADSGYGRLVVSGVATFDAGSSIALKKTGSTYAFAQGQRYVVVQANNANANYNAGALNYSAIGFTGTVTGASVVDTDNANKTDLILTLTGGGSTPVNAATSSDAKAALGGLFNYTGTNANMLNLFNPAAALGTSDAANKAGAQLSPAATGTSLAQSVQVSTQAVIDVTTAHIDAVRVAQASGSGSGIATGERPNDVAVWGQAFYGQANQNDRTGAAGYKAGYNGTLIGVDTAVGDQWRAGGLFSYANTSMANTGDNTGSSGHATSYGVTGYAGYAGDTWYLDLSAGVATQKYNTLRVVNFTGFSGSAAGSFDGMQYIASAQAGYPIKLDAVTTLTPIAGLTYSRLHQDGYTETGSAAALQIGSSSTTSIKSDLGAKLERVFKTSYGDLTPSAQLSWRHEYRDTGLRSVASFAADTTGSTSFVSQAVAPEKDTGVLVLGVTLARSQNLTLSGHYTLEAAGGYTAQTADVRLRYQF